MDSELHAFLQKNECLNFFFVYRWVLLMFKREFTFDNVLSSTTPPPSTPPLLLPFLISQICSLKCLEGDTSMCFPEPCDGIHKLHEMMDYWELSHFQPSMRKMIIRCFIDGQSQW